MNCPKCGTQNDDSAKFCPRCYFRFNKAEAKHPTEKGKAATKSVKIGVSLILVLVFVILVVYLFIGFGPFWRMFDREIVHEYDRRLAETNTIFNEHDALSKKSLETTVKKDPIASASFAKEYSEKTGRWAQALNDFKLFIEANERRIRRVGINPDYMRDNIKNTLGVMKENEVRFHKEADDVGKEADQLRMQPARDAIAALQKIEARFLVGISYRDYAPVLGETVHQVRVFLESPVAAESRELAAAIQKVIFHYAMVKEVWDVEIRKNARNIVVDQGDKNPGMLDRILSLYPEVKNIKFLAAYGSKPSYLYPYADIRNVILLKASEELRKVTTLMHGKSFD
jgi:hypothetical protein